MSDQQLAMDLGSLAHLSQVLNNSPLLLDQLELVAQVAAELTASDHADITLFDPFLKRYIPARSSRVFMHQGDEDAAAWIRSTASPLLISDLNLSTSDNDLILYNRDITSYLGVPIGRDGQVDGALMVFCREPREFSKGEPERLAMLANLASMAIHQHRLQHDSEEAARLLLRLALTDPQTGVATAQQFQQLLETEWQRSVDAGLPIAILQIEVSGGAEGQVLLARVARLLQASLFRARDTIARVDSSRLAVLLPETDEQGALAIARRLRREVAQLEQTAELTVGASWFDTLRISRGPQVDAVQLKERALAALELASSDAPLKSLPL